MNPRSPLLLTLGTGVLAGFALALTGRVFADRSSASAAARSAPAGPGDALPWQDARLLAEVLQRVRDRKSTRLNSSHLVISYAVFCLKKKKKYINRSTPNKTQYNK